MTNKKLFFYSLLLASLALACNKPQTATTAPAQQADSATFDADGTAHITRTIPMPATISPEAQQWLAGLSKSTPGPEDLATRRKRTDEWRAKQSAEARRLFPVNLESTTIAGVPTDILTPLPPTKIPASNTHLRSRNLVLINLHGGGFTVDAGSVTENVPIAAYANVTVVAASVSALPPFLGNLSTLPEPVEQ